MLNKKQNKSLLFGACALTMNQRHMKFYTTLTLGLLALTSFISVQAKTVRIVGADLLGAHIQSMIKAEADKAGWDVKVLFEGSLKGKEQVLNGEGDLAILAIPDGEAIDPVLASIPFSFEVASIIVNDANPLNEISYEQLKLLFGTGGRSVMENWGQLGGTGPWANRQILVHIVRDYNSLSLELFRKKVLGQAEFRDKVQEWSSRDALLKHIVEVNGGIGIVPGNRTIAQTRLLFVSQTDKAQSYRPSEQSVLYSDYSLRLPYYLAYKSGTELSSEVKRVARFLLSDEVTKALVSAGYISLPKNERHEYQMELELGE